MMESKRVRLLFRDKEAILSQSQKSGGFKRCWLLLKPQHQIIADLSDYILTAFQLHPSCPHGLILSMDGFVLPPFESTCILKDKDIISVRKKKLTFSVEGNNAAYSVEELQIMEKQTVNSGALLLANEEFEKETGGYQSDEPEDESKQDDEEEKSIDESEDEEEQMEDSLHLEKSRPVDATTKKRKAPEKLQGSKKKKQRFEVQEGVQDDDAAKQVENSHQDNGGAGKETLHKKRNASNLKKRKEDDGDKNSVELNDGKMDSSPNAKGTDHIKKEGDESLEASEKSRKGPSRSARRKKAKRRWIREMAKIQIQAEASRPKELQNWKKKSAPARAERKKHNNWKQKPANNKEDNGGPKGLLHWKSWSANDKSEDKKQDEETHQNGSMSEQPNQKNNMEDEVVPVVIRPGHIRFEPLEEDQAARQSQVSAESLQWNGITSKRKGQKWGTEKPSYSLRDDDKDGNVLQSYVSSTSKEANLNHQIDFDKLPSLSSLPKEGDIIGYRLLELSSSWTPELSSFRVGQVSWCNPQSGKVLLMPVAEYPITFGKSDENKSDQQVDSPLYKEDGSLEIDFSALADVRIVKDGRGGSIEAETGGANGGPPSVENAVLSVTLASKDKQIEGSAPENGEVNHRNEKNTSTGNGVDLWEQISETLTAKKAQLTQESSWGKPKATTSSGSWSYRALKGSAMGPTVALLRSKNKLRNT